VAKTTAEEFVGCIEARTNGRTIHMQAAKASVTAVGSCPEISDQPSLFNAPPEIGQEGKLGFRSME